MARAHVVTSAVVGVLVAATGLGAPKRSEPPTARLTKLIVELPSPDVARLTLRGTALPGGVPSGLTRQVLTVGSDVAIPLGAVPVLSGDATSTSASFDVQLREIPERVLSLDSSRCEIRWEGLDGKGTAVAALAGTLDLGDPGATELPQRKLYDAYARLSQLAVTPGLTSVHVGASLSLLNPFGFDIPISRVLATVRVGDKAIVTVQRPAFRLHAGARSEVPIEQDVGLAEVAGGMAGLLHGDPATLDGEIVIQTPTGERVVPLHLGAAQ